MSKFNDLMLEYTEKHGLPTEREELLERIVDATFHAEDEAANLVDRRIRNARGESPVSHEDLVRANAMIDVANTLGLRITEGPWPTDENKSPSCPAGP